MIKALSETERNGALYGLPDWDFDEARDAIVRRFAFMTQAAFPGVTSKWPRQSKL